MQRQQPSPQVSRVSRSFRTRWNPLGGGTKVARPGRVAHTYRPGAWTRFKCRRVPAYADVRGWVLTNVYGVPPRLLSMYPPNVYSLEMARADLDMCKLGQPLRYFDRVVRVDRAAGRDASRWKAYALTRYHGYRPDEKAAMNSLPYSTKDAQIDIAYFQRHGRPYFQVNKYRSEVYDPKRGFLRDWRYNGFSDGYTYSPTAGAKAQRFLSDRMPKKFKKKDYPLAQLPSGQYVRKIPCAVVGAAYCRPGQSEYLLPVSRAHAREHGGVGGIIPRGGRGAGGSGSGNAAARAVALRAASATAAGRRRQ